VDGWEVWLRPFDHSALPLSGRQSPGEHPVAMIVRAQPCFPPVLLFSC
jgi:hypothetical protein